MSNGLNSLNMLMDILPEPNDGNFNGISDVVIVVLKMFFRLIWEKYKRKGSASI